MSIASASWMQPLIRLQPWSIDAIDAISAAERMLYDPRVQRTLFAAHLRIGTADALKIWKQNIGIGRLCYVAVLESSEDCVGAVAVELGNLSFFVDPEQWGKGYGSTMVQSMMYGPLRDNDLEHVNATATRENFASRRILQTVGFREVGIRPMPRGLPPLIEHRWTAEDA